ncbi:MULTISPECIES: protein phosphatase 2C domain-containing protein [Bifidobacterium]|jgi:protein phosphatase|uniref:protein phosphatase 2C domain-containing protein n=1 Tax=Bifidobacterium TaxID=1678 RepID=UPI0023566A41|nr:protein phosphatase 2C domain-containing protein [Bifidobacterium tibiigranuli]MCH3975828.1 protein phosphatase 2C domain-containing protein [Bifidobacterium tibiigranuli]MCH4189252.1 protein phosphatase 2C domain-containing protein [Bifidobacterium tibiigranuli]MCH4203113.1 protein phosphatase 2C domain-containing protein [Bifidobacterium tibiigranuli]MCH4274738.1 protein phosphatase 2C domain-containing protein [Bifidobacterium tibiigranuli]MCI1211613.1 protein phosphatase 2C domain-conta
MPQSDASPTLFLYSTTISDVGTVRSNNQDSSFAGEHLVAICDGMGGHAGGDTASTIAIRSLAHIERDDVRSNVRTVSSMMETSVMAAHDAIVGKAKRERKLAGMGTTVTAVTLVGGYWILAHIGDSRAYLLRDGTLTRMTTDHSYVQHLIDTGRITAAEARNHPQRNVVMRVLGDFDIDPHPDIAICAAHPADRWLLCSDGLDGVLEDSTIQETLAQCADQGECAQRLVSMALKAGSTDNVTAVIGDATLALDADAFDLPHQTPLIGGAAAASLEAIADIINEPVASAPNLRHDNDSPAQRAAALTQNPNTETQLVEPRVAQPSAMREQTSDEGETNTGEIPVVQKKDGRLSADPNDPEVAKAMHRERVQEQQASRSRRRRRRIIVLISVLVLLAAALGSCFAAWRWSQSKYYLGEANGVVSIYQGVNTNLFGYPLSHKVENTSIKISQLPQSWRDQLDQGIAVDSLSEAHSHAQLIEREAKSLPESSADGSSNGGAKSGSSASPSASASQSGQSSPSSSAKSASSAASPSPSSPASSSKGAK